MAICHYSGMLFCLKGRGSDLRIRGAECRPQASNDRCASVSAARTDRQYQRDQKRSSDFISFLGRLDARSTGQLCKTQTSSSSFSDNGPIHTSKASQAALAARPWLTVEWLPKYAPELNDIERAWRNQKRHFPAHQTFIDTDHLDRAIHNAVNDMKVERQPLPCTNLRIAA